MKLERLEVEALQAAACAKHNLKLIRKHPEKLKPGSHQRAEAYLKLMIRFAKYETKRSRPGRRLWVKLKSSISNILFHISKGRKPSKEEMA